MSKATNLTFAVKNLVNPPIHTFELSHARRYVKNINNVTSLIIGKKSFFLGKRSARIQILKYVVSL